MQSLRYALLGLALTGPLALSFGQGNPFPPLGPVPVPPGNPITLDKVNLGKALFWDEQLSSTRTVACGTCHQFPAGGQDPRSLSAPTLSTHPGNDQMFGTADDLLGSPGVVRHDAQGEMQPHASFGLHRQVTPRRSMTMINVAYHDFFFWDGRAEDSFHDPISGATVLSVGGGLESVVAEPFIDSTEMGHEGRTWQDVVQRIESVQPLALSPQIPAPLNTWIAGRDYAQLFGDAFGTQEVTASRVCLAIATYIRTLVSDQTPFDHHLSGVPNALTPAQLDGFQTFQTNFCASCHTPPHFVGDQEITSFFYTGVRPRTDDLGRFEETGDPQDRGLMKIVGLRNAKLRAPYFHAGTKANLSAVLDFYESGGDFEVGTNHVLPAQPTSGTQRANLLDFLENALTDPRVEQGLPPFDHPALSEGTVRVPSAYGSGTAGSNGSAPTIHAFQAAHMGGAPFEIALSGAAPGAHAALLIGFDDDPAGTPFLGANLFVTRTSGLIAFERIHALAHDNVAQGWGMHSLHLPNSATLAGTTLYAQWIVLDPHPGGSLAASEAMAFTLFD